MKEKIGKLEAHVPNIARMFKAFSNEHRIKNLCHLMSKDEEVAFSVLANRIQLSELTLSQHLARLRKADLIVMRSAGRFFFSPC